MNLQLRPYQQDGVAQILAAYKQGKKSVLYVAPTGSGKTVLFSYIAQSAMKKGKRIIVLAHRRELIIQASRKLSESGVPHGIIMPGMPYYNQNNVQVASVQTLVRRLDDIPKPDLLIVDEAAHCSANQSSWRRVVDYYAGCRVLGVTATPCRLDGAGLGVQVGGIFDHMVVGPTIQELTNMGFITPCDVYSPPSGVELEKMHIVAGDYNKAEMEEEMDKPRVTGCAVTHYRKICDGVPAIAFCASVQHAKNVAQAFREAGYVATHVDGTMRERDRDIAMQGLAMKQIHVITSCDIISEGVDVPVVTCGIMLRPTQSMGLHLQQCGRCLRPSPGKNMAIILDHVGNCMRHGLPHENREWSLNACREDRRKKQEKQVALRQCEKCFHVHPPAPQCPKCGYVYPVKPRKLEEVDGELRKLTPEEFEARRIKARARQAQGMCRELKALIQLGIQRGYKNPAAWAQFVWRGRQRDKANWGGAVAI